MLQMKQQTNESNKLYTGWQKKAFRNICRQSGIATEINSFHRKRNNLTDIYNTK